MDDDTKTPRINTAGNRSHYLGFGFVTGFNEEDRGQYDSPQPIDFCSGAAMMVRAEIIKAHGLFDDDFFLYLEDADLGWKIRMAGYESHFVPQSVVWHRHDPAATLKHYYWLERNRWMLLFSYYKWPTLLLIGPMIDLMEIGTLFHAWRIGRLKDKCRVYRAFFLSGTGEGSAIDLLWEKRARVQGMRRVSDRAFAKHFAGRITFGPLNRGVMRWLVNPILGVWWAVVRRMMWW
jgi:GT2 family glycosyltransferase